MSAIVLVITTLCLAHGVSPGLADYDDPPRFRVRAEVVSALRYLFLTALQVDGFDKLMSFCAWQTVGHACRMYGTRF